jgi:DNA mismatch repair protein MutL
MKTDTSVPVIHILDPATINQIAAGEVVERPASVVKELVENAIDAGARVIRIDISSSANAIASIRVTDDGSGMSPADALLAFTPHATSKISTVEDLPRVHTLGFRGEALASIAAVARVTLITKSLNSAAIEGTKVRIEGGVIMENTGIGAPEGTSVLVEDLFFNTPARKKFQKSKNTELVHIHAVIEGLCLARPEISFRLFHNRNEQLVTDRTTRSLDTIARIYGSEIITQLIPVNVSLPLITLSGHISRPSLSRRDAARMLISLNKRYISSTLINGAIIAGYGTLLTKDRFPVAFLTLTIDTTLVDVNVHPTKKQVRLSCEKEITEAIKNAIRTTLLTHDLIPAVDVISPANTILSPVSDYDSAREYGYTGAPPSGVCEPTHTGTSSTDQRLRQTELVTGISTVHSQLPAMNVIGEFGGIYIIARTSTDELMLIDQHAAHERILYEQVTGRLKKEHRSQELIAPVVIHRTPKETSVIRDLLPTLDEEGFFLEEFGKDTFLVRAIPVVLGRMEETRIIDEIISDLVSEGQVRSVNNRERITRIIACRGAIKAGTVCTQEQCQRVVDQLRLTKNPYTCPHGRPTMVRFTRADLDSMFKRT